MTQEAGMRTGPAQADLFAAQDAPEDRRGAQVARYLELTRRTLPDMARRSRPDWPVRDDHCFQRIVLDAVCGGCWYDHLQRPAHRHLGAAQATRAVALCEAIVQGTADLDALNRQSLAWRGKLRADAPRGSRQGVDSDPHMI
jgi:hypothetical protein